MTKKQFYFSSARVLERLLTPRKPVDRVRRVLPQIGLFSFANLLLAGIVAIVKVPRLYV